MKLHKTSVSARVFERINQLLLCFTTLFVSNLCVLRALRPLPLISNVPLVSYSRLQPLLLIPTFLSVLRARPARFQVKVNPLREAGSPFCFCCNPTLFGQPRSHLADRAPTPVCQLAWATSACCWCHFPRTGSRPIYRY